MPPYWKLFVEQHDLVAREFSISEERDLSGVGAEIEILDEQNSEWERTQTYPGIGVFPAGFIPVGSCGVGSGDPYFICTKDGEGGPLYRIYHDEVISENYDRTRAIVVVLGDYRELLKFAND